MAKEVVPKWEINQAIQIGKEAVLLTENRKKELDPRVSAGLLDGLPADIAQLESLLTGRPAKTVEVKGLTGSEKDVSRKGAEWVGAVREAVKRRAKGTGLAKAVGVGSPVYPGQSKSVASAIEAVLAAAKENPILDIRSSLYTNAAAVCGLRCAADMAEYTGDQSRATTYRNYAQMVYNGITNRLWDYSQHAYYTAIGASGPFHDLTECAGDQMVICWPYHILAVDDATAAETADYIENYLASTSDSIWIPMRLMMANYWKDRGDETKAKAHIDFALDKRTECGWIPEVVTKQTDGQWLQEWGKPLSWSQAQFVLALLHYNGYELPLPCAFTCNASGSPATGQPPLSVIFTCTVTRSSDCAANLTYDWDFGDGTPHGTQQSTSHTYSSIGTYKWNLTVSDGESMCAKNGTVAIANPPVVSSMQKLKNPFRACVTGSNLQNGIQIYIGSDAMRWSPVMWKSTSKLIIGGGTALKSKVPKGVATTFRFLNPDGGETTKTWSW